MAVDFDELLVEMKPLLGERVAKLRTAYVLAPPEMRRSMEAWLQGQAANLLGKKVGENPSLLSPPPAELVTGPFTVGTVMYHDRELFPVGLTERSMLGHIGVFGRTGTGKTNFTLSLLHQLRAKAVPFLVLDWKRNYRDLLPDVPDLKVFTVGRPVAPFAFQPLIPPPGTTPTTWLKLLNDVIASSFYVGEGVKYLLMKAIDAVYREWGVYGGDVQAWPTFRDVNNWLEAYKPANARESQWMISTQRTLQSLCYGEIGRVVNARQQTPLQDLLKQNVVLELDALTETDKTFFSEALLLWIHHYRMQEDGRETLKHAIVIEEAHHLLRETPTQVESVMEVTLREIRELGESLILIDQTPSQIAPTALANTGTKIFLGLSHRADITTAAAALLLDNEQKDFLGQLPTGVGIMKLQDRHFMPFVVKVPHVRLRKGMVTDDDLRKMQPIVSAVSAANSEVLTSPSLIPAADKVGSQSDAVQEPVTADESKVQVDVNAWSLLVDVLSRPCIDGVNARYKRLRLSTRKGQGAKDALVRAGLVEEHDVPLTRGRITLLSLTEAGRREARQRGLSPPPRQNTGIVHEFWRYHAIRRLESEGYTVEREVRIPGDGFVDLVATKGTERLAVEIETGLSDTGKNIRKTLSGDFTGLIVVCTTPEAQRKTDVALEKLTGKQRAAVQVWGTGDVWV